MKKQISNPEETFVLLLKEHKIREPRRELRFHAVRKWRFDFAWEKELVAVEIEGLLFRGRGGHQTGVGFLKDAEKYFTGLELGWTIIRVPGVWTYQLKYWPLMKRVLDYLKEKIGDKKI